MTPSGRMPAHASVRPNFAVRSLAILGFILLSGLVAIFFYCAAHAVQKPFTLDETDIALRAHLINHEGPFPEGFVTGSAEALTHPPLYEFVVALLFRIWGEKESVVRIFGILNYLAVIWISGWTLNFLTRAFRPAIRYGAFAVLLGVMLSNPLMIQHAMLLDADTTGNALCAALFLCVFVRAEQARPALFWVSRFALALVVAAMFLFKEVGPFLILAGVSVYRIVNRDFKRLLIDLIVVLGLGALLAWAVWSAYAHALGMDPMRIYASQDSARYSRVSSFHFILKAIKALPVIVRWPVYWNSAPLILFAGLMVIFRAIRFIKMKKLELVDAVWLCALAVWLPFLLVKPSIDMMKYQFPVCSLIFVAAIYGAAEFFQARWRDVDAADLKPGVVRILAGGCVVLTAVLFVYYHRMGDYLLLLFNRGDRPVWKEFIFQYYLPLAILGVCVFVAGRLRRNTLALLLPALLLSSLPIHTALNLRQVGGYTTVESWMNYGEKGLADTVQYLSANLRPGRITCFRKDIRYYVERRHGISVKQNLDPGDIYLTSDAQMASFEAFLKAAGPDFIVADPVSLLRVPAERMKKIEAVLARYYAPDQVFGSFRIFRKIVQR